MDEVVWQFLAVFLAASLAFVLEDIRERRRTARWVKQHLRHLAELIADESGQADLVMSASNRQLAAIDAWLNASQELDLSDDQWKEISNRWVSANLDLGPVLRSEALSALPEDLARALTRLEQAFRYVESASAALARTQDRVEDAWARREAPLSPVNARRVSELRNSLDDLSQHMPTMYENLTEIARIIDEPRNRSSFLRV